MNQCCWYYSKVHPSVCLKMFADIYLWMNLRSGLKFGMLMYPDHHSNQFHFGHGMLISSFWRLFDWTKLVKFEIFGNSLWEPLEMMAWNVACWCILTTQRANFVHYLHFGATLNGLTFGMLIYPGQLQNWWDFGHGHWFWRNLDLMKWDKYSVNNYHIDNDW